MRYLTEASRARIGLRIRQARKQSGLSHDRLAARVGTSRQHLIKLEHGKHAPGRPMLSRIATATGKRVEWFTADEDEDPSLLADELLRRAIRQMIREEADSQ